MESKLPMYRFFLWAHGNLLEFPKCAILLDFYAREPDKNTELWRDFFYRILCVSERQKTPA